jgi:hypothetical protein
LTITNGKNNPLADFLPGDIQSGTYSLANP